MSERPLTAREREVLICRCAEFLTLEDTADRLGIARETAAAAQGKAFRKLGVERIGGACFLFGLRAARLRDEAARRESAWTGRKHTPETIEKMRAAYRDRTAQARKSA